MNPTVIVENLLDPSKHLNSYAQVQFKLPEFPRQVRVETSSFCNSSCSWCHFHGDFKPATRTKGRMTRELFSAILDDIASWPKPLQEIVPTVWGEVFLNKSWAWMLMEIARRLPQTGIHIVTTGILLNDENLEQLAQVPTLKYFNASINAFFSETWERTHKVPAKHMPTAIAAVHKFRDRRPDVQVNVSMVHDPELVTELEKDLFKEYWGMFGSVTVSNVSFAGHPTRGPKEPVTLACRSVVDGLVLLDSGLVGTGCCFWNGDAAELAIGTFPTEKLLDIWRGERLRRILELHNSGRRAELSLCNNCTFA